MKASLRRRVAGGLVPRALVALVALETSARAEDVTIQTNTPGLHVWNRTSNVANVPVRVGRGTEIERAAVFAPVCASAPCETNLGRGAHVLGLSLDREPVVESDEAVHIDGPTTLKADYHDRSAFRAAGWGLFISSLATAIILVAVGADKGTLESSHSIDPIYGGIAAGVGLGGLIGGLALIAQSDSATFSVAPLPPLGGTGKRDEPSGAGSGLAIRIRF